jgi:UDP-glucose 4-epimerase
VICLIGGGGFIGSRMRERLALQGVAVTVATRSPPAVRRPNESYIDLSVRDAFHRRRFDAIIDLASGAARDWRRAARLAHVDQEAASLAERLDLLSGADVGKYVYFSTGGAIYGDCGQRPCRESDPPQPLSPYGKAKLACENIVGQRRTAQDLPTIIVRPSNVYGPGQQPFIGQGIVASAFGAACRGEPVTIFGDGLNVRDYLFIDDLCDAIDAIIRDVAPGETLNIGSGAGVTLLALMQLIGRLSTDKGWSLDLLFHPARSVDVRYNVVDAARLRALTSWQPATGLSAGLAKTRDWIETFLIGR